MSAATGENRVEKFDEMPAGRGHLKLRYVLQALRKRKGRLFVAFVILLLVFSAFALLQHWFVRQQIYRATARELGSWAEQIADEINYTSKWDLEGYRQATITVPSWYVLTSDGLIVDIEGFIPGIFHRVTPPDDAIFGGPISEKTPVNETWRLLGKKIDGGYVVLGVCSPDFTADTDSKLRANAAKFGSNLAKATSIRTRDVDSVVDYAVVSSEGELELAEGRVPLKIDPAKLPKPADHFARLVTNAGSYLLYFRPIIRVTDNQLVGTIIVPKDATLAEQASRSQDHFNLWIAGMTGTLVVAIAFGLIIRELLDQTKAVTLEEALKVGESRSIEFKRVLQWDPQQGGKNEDKRLAVLKSIAGFLNTTGGTLFIGVAEDNKTGPTLYGIAEDLSLLQNSKDKLQRLLRDLITTRIGSEFAPFISDRFEEANGQVCWIIVVDESPVPAFVRWKTKEDSREERKFFVREGPKTSDLDNESTWLYIKNKWR